MNENKIVSVLDENGKKTDLILLDIFEVDGLNYALLTESEENEEALIYKVVGSEGNVTYEFISDDEEYNRVFDALEESF